MIRVSLYIIEFVILLILRSKRMQDICTILQNLVGLLLCQARSMEQRRIIFNVAELPILISKKLFEYLQLLRGLLKAMLFLQA